MPRTPGSIEVDAAQRTAARNVALEVLSRVGGDVVIYATEAGNILWISPSASAYGFDPEAMIGTQLFRWVDPAQAIGMHQVRHAALAHGETTLRWQLQRPGTDQDVWFDSHIYAVDSIDPDHGKQSTVSILREVSDGQRGAEPHSVQQYFQMMTESIHDVLSVTDADGRVLYVTPSVQQMLGWTPTELIGANMRDLVHPDEATRLATPATNSLAGRARLRTRGDDWVWVQWSSTAVPDGKGGTWWVSVTRDIGESLDREEFDVELLSLYSNYVRSRNGDDPAWAYDSLARLGRYAGADRSSLLLLDDCDLDDNDPPELQDCHQWAAAGVEPRQSMAHIYELLTHQELLSFLRPGRQVQWDSTHIPPNLREVAARYRQRENLEAVLALPLFGDAELCGILLLESSRPHRWRRSAATLQRIVAQLLTSSLQQRRQLCELEEQKAIAEQANAAKDDFLSRVSHELRTPMNGVIGYAQLLVEELEELESKADAQQILLSGRHLLGLIEDVLTVTETSGAKVTRKIEPVSVAAVAADAAAIIRPYALEQRVDVTIDDIAPDVQVMAISDRLRQILLNLLSNGIKFNRPGGAVRIAAHSDGDTVRIDVFDTGRGIDEQSLDRLFAPFERLDADELDIEGSGLGLSVVRTLVTAMNGTVEVSSQLDAGSTFSVTLPASSRRRSRSTARKRTNRAARRS